VSEGEVTEIETELRKWFSNCMQIPNTRGNHCYIPLSSNTVRLFQVSGSSIFLYAHVSRQYSGPTHIEYSDIALHCYIDCTMVENGGSVL
jgi:hypothetical protein